MKKYVFWLSIMATCAFLSACGNSAKDLKLSEMGEPQNKKSILEQLTPDERNLLTQYMTSHAMRGGIDYTVKIGDAIKEQQKIKDTLNKIH